MTDAPRQRWYLRPVWVALAVLSVVVAAVAATIGIYARQRVAALAWVERLGGVVEFEPLPEWVPERVAAYWPNWARRIEVLALMDVAGEDLGRLRMLRDAKIVDFYNAPVTDLQMRPLSSFYRMETLQVDAANLTDAGVAPLSGCRSLRHLSLESQWSDHPGSIAIGDEGLRHLAGLPIEELGLSDTRAADAGMDALSHLPRLRELYLNGTAVGDAGLEQLKSTRLEWLFLEDTRVTDAGLSALGTMSHLEGVDLSWTEVGDAGLAALATSPRLCDLNLRQTRVTNAGLAHLSKLPLRRVDLSYTEVNDEGLKHLGGLKTLEVLNLDVTKCTREGAAELGRTLGLNLERGRLLLSRK